MTGAPPGLEPQREIPFPRLVKKLIYGNVFVSGLLYLTTVAALLYDCLKWNAWEELAPNLVEMNKEILFSFLEEPLLLILLVVPGTVVGLVWYLIARFLEAKRWRDAHSATPGP